MSNLMVKLGDVLQIIGYLIGILFYGSLILLVILVCLVIRLALPILAVVLTVYLMKHM